MKIFILSALFLTAIAPAFGEDTCSERDKLKELQTKVSAYKPALPAQSSGVDEQSGKMGTHGDNMGAAIAATDACAKTQTGFAGEFDKLKKKMDGKDECQEELKDAKRGAASARKEAAKCKKAGSAASEKGDTSKDNASKMGPADTKKADDKKDAKGGGSPPSMPTPPSPPKKDDQKKEPDYAALEKDRETKVATCKATATTTHAANLKNCEANNYVVPGMPVATVQENQDKCKADENNQYPLETAKCDQIPLAIPPAN